MATDLSPVDLRSDPTAETTSSLLGLDVAADQDRPFELFRDWIHSRWYPKRGKFSFLGGVLEAEMSPESLFDHNLVKEALGGAIHVIRKQEQLGRLYVDRALFIHEGLKIATEPDLMFCLWSTLRENRVECRPYQGARKGRVEVHGVPDLMVEIVSESSVRKDKTLLKQLYFAAGIPEYWLVDAREGRLEFTVFQRSDTEFVPSVVDEGGYRFSKTFNRSFMLERSPDPVGEDAYDLKWR
jgi:Uma2 family endonuclease